VRQTSSTCSDRAGIFDRPAPGADFTELVALRDFLSVHLAKLPAKQRATVMAWAEGQSCVEIAIAQRVSKQSVHERLSAAVKTLRQLAGVGEE
jgi:DNA-directed RNA polymerase specialized sigma24 family protein